MYMPIKLKCWGNTAQDRNFRNDTNRNWDTLEYGFNNVVEITSVAAFEKVVGSAKIVWLSPVNKFSDLTTTYPQAVEGNTVMVRDTGKIYRFNGTQWIEIQDINPTALNEVDNRLTKYMELQGVHLTQFGAIGDGIADDTQAFKNALKYLTDHNLRRLIIPPCSEFYKITSNLEINQNLSNLKIDASGLLSLIKLVKRTNAGHAIGFSGTATDELSWIQNVTVNNLIVAVEYEAGTNLEGLLDNPIGISNAKSVTFNNTHSIKSPWKGISVQKNCKHIVFNDCSASNSKKYGMGVEFSSVEDVTFNNCTAKNNLEQGFHLTNAGDQGYLGTMVLSNCKAYENGLEGVGVSGADRPSIDCASYSNGGAGIKLFNCVRAYVEGKSFGNALAGFHTLLGERHTVHLDSRNNSLNDPDVRGNFFFESTPYCKLINSIGNSGLRSYTSWSEGLLILGSDLTSTTYLALKNDLATQTERIQLNPDGTVVVRFGAIPTLGSWKRGDRVENTTPIAGGIPGWVCIANGSPGLWRPESVLGI